jgi:hypothetical protein
MPHLTRITVGSALLLIGLLACSHSQPLDISAPRNGSELAALDPGEFECLAAPVHEIVMLPPQVVRSIRGKAVHRGEPLEDVHVFLEPVLGRSDMAFHEQTSADGRFQFEGLEDGSYRLRTCYYGWNVTMLEVDIDSYADEIALTIPMTRW